ncbi:glycoside hydrolase [Niastella vici]|uniref:chitinase n=1 Tax=Niastella vici TaxID=1703345 RepID=A0A1V9FU40_9BACT|nr:glycosyl hydrolase family 18 protein [Niastella vici]OQP61756.1 glycoside hydrolase [Niastella vici]
MKKNLPVSIFLLLLLFASVQRVAAQFRVIGYMPSWTGDVNAVQYSKLTHINYAFLLPTATGGIQSIENPSKLQSLVSLAHSNGVKVMISVGGWNNGDDSGFETLAGNSSYRSTFVTNMINFVNQYGLDGVDIDWEYPDAGTSANNYVTLMTQLATEMHNRGKLLTAAVVGTGGNSILPAVFNVVDFLNLMAYDYNNYDHSTYAYAQQSMSYWRGQGLPQSKCVLGVPFYGRPSWETFAALVARGADPYADTYNGVGYNGITTIKNKTNLAFDQGSGIMIWELSGDATGSNSLVSAIHDVVLTHGGGNTTGVATFYKDCSYGGYAVSLPVGTYTRTQMIASGISDDDISSLKVQSGYKVTLYWDDNFTGTTLVKTGDDDCLVDDGWNDKVTSIAISTNTSATSILIQAENYNNMAGIQTETCTDDGGGLNVGYIDATDWMAYYNINFPVSGTYKVEYRVASLSGGGTVSCDLNAGSIQLGQLAVPSTGGWQNWTTISHNVTITAGTYNFGVYAQAGGWNLNWIRITPLSTAKVATTAGMVNSLIDNSVQTDKAFTIYPNPVHQQLNISNGGESLSGGIIRIYDIMGKQVVTARPAANQINVSSLAPGVYTLEFTKNGKRIVRQFIK